MTDWSKIVCGDDLISAVKERSKPFLTKQVSPDVASIEISNGWTEIKRNKSGKVVTLRKDKKSTDLFENKVWMIFYKMGFTHMNVDNDFVIDLNGNSKQVDVVAMDDETCILIECKSSKSLDKTTTFKQELESIHGYFSDACDAIRAKFGERQFKFIFATENYVIADDSKDSERMSSFGIYYMNDDATQYYSQLADHLGKAARYQLLGNLFTNTEIKGIESTVTAIKGVMSDLPYFSFLIEPGRLLKLAYVLHRNEANHLLMPTYQRLIKKDRLNAIRQFVNGGGYFPNSLIVSIDYKDEGEPFVAFENQPSSGAIAGTLTLPKKYRSIYVIDGQHRLYGYSDSDMAFSNVVPVVAFINLPPERQVAMFMEINENQKKVSKALRNTLNVDLLWKSSNPRERKEALMLKVAEELGDHKRSPLYGRIVTGENSTTELRCITTEFIKDAFKDSKFLNEYAKNGEKSRIGTIDKDNNDKTSQILFSLMCDCFGTVADLLKDEWNKGSQGFLAINNVAYGLIRIFDDIINIYLSKNGKTFVNDFEDAKTFYVVMILDLCEAIEGMDAQTQAKLKEKGGSAKKTAWRTLQVALNSKNAEFTSDDLQEYIADYCTDNNPDAEKYLTDIETLLKDRFKAVFGTEPDWLIKYAPISVATKISSNQVETNLKRKVQGFTEFDTWYFISFNELCEIAMNSSNWTMFAQDILSRPDIKNTKVVAATWMKDLARYKDKVRRKEHITRAEFAQISAIYNDYFPEAHDADNQMGGE